MKKKPWVQKVKTAGLESQELERRQQREGRQGPQSETAHVEPPSHNIKHDTATRCKL